MSKQIITGTVEKIFSKDKEEDRYGNTCFVSAKIGENWVGFGAKKKPVINVKRGGEWYQLQEGDVVEVVADTNAKGYLQAKSSDVTVKEKGNGQSYGPAGAKPSGTTMSNDHRQDSIMRQSAMGYAATVVAATLTSKSNPRDAAQIVLEIADEVFLPYAKYGRVGSDNHTALEAEAERQEQNHQQNHQNQQDEEDFNESDIPF